MVRRILFMAAAAGVLAAPVAQADEALLKKHNCTACHQMDKKVVGPAYNDIAKKYKGQKGIAVKLAEKSIEQVPWFGRIVKVSGAKIMINTGQEDGRDAGEEFTVERAGEAMTDPDTGESLGSEVEKVGRIKIVAVKGKKLSEAAVVDGSGFQEGDMIKEAD